MPDLIGLIPQAVLRIADSGGFTLAISSPELPIEQLTSSARWQVTGQDPEAGAGRFRGDTVAVTFRHERGPDAGDREPSGPPPPRRRRAVLLDPDDEADGPDRPALRSVDH
ncbi:PASTA domain-containing protein [Nakamurella leprariae]|uniref:PASTA domain-containing protein n=1 Tax=Nakamurella leprariae TaxID=2803911 RepID=A0A938Y5F5_9ACTN|nr:PASTA domain-containing protein [Nakamurella leprariae]MBM9466125.1 PASTA domain-containing protein [Nakamurella leprariae]